MCAAFQVKEALAGWKKSVDAGARGRGQDCHRQLWHVGNMCAVWVAA